MQTLKQLWAVWLFLGLLLLGVITIRVNHSHEQTEAIAEQSDTTTVETEAELEFYGLFLITGHDDNQEVQGYMLKDTQVPVVLNYCLYAVDYEQKDNQIILKWTDWRILRPDVYDLKIIKIVNMITGEEN